MACELYLNRTVIKSIYLGDSNCIHILYIGCLTYFIYCDLCIFNIHMSQKLSRQEQLWLVGPRLHKNSLLMFSFPLCASLFL